MWAAVTQFCSFLQIHTPASCCPSLSLSSPFQHRNTDTRLHTCLPLIAIKPWLTFSRCLFEWHNIYIFLFFFPSILQSETLKYESLSPPEKTNTSRCLLLYINSKPLVVTKCLFNENGFVSSLSQCLMAPLLLQVPERSGDIWQRKTAPRTKTTKHAHTHVLAHNCARPQTLYISASLSINQIQKRMQLVWLLLLPWQARTVWVVRARYFWVHLIIRDCEVWKKAQVTGTKPFSISLTG